MIRLSFRPLVCCLSLALCAVPLAQSAQAAPLTLDFLPPQMEPRDICFSGPPPVGDDTQQSAVVALTDKDRIAFLRRDIRNYMARDAAGYFDFINALIMRRGKIDPDFTDVDVTLAQVDLWLRAGRLAALQEAGLIEGLRNRVEEMSNNQRVTLARFYTDGTGVARDTAFAQDLLREAAYGGNASALLEIVRLAQAGQLVKGWDAPLDLTITMAFGGILGALDSGVCRRAERISEAYAKGDVVTANPALAQAWLRFSADMGSADAAWRVVEFHLNADAASRDNTLLRRYLTQAVRLGIAVPPGREAALVASGAVTAEELAEMLGFNHLPKEDRGKTRLAPLLRLSVNLATDEPNQDGKFLRYQREIASMPEAPGHVFSTLALEIGLKKGRWAGEAEARVLLEKAAALGDARGMRQLAALLMRYRDVPSEVARAETLLMEAVARHGMPEAMRDLDRLYRCQVTDAPRLRQADLWAASYAATGAATVQSTAADVLALTPRRKPETIAKIQSLALSGRSQMVATHALRVQADPLASTAARRYWAQRMNRSKQALEAFAGYGFDLAHTPAERDSAIKLLRRVHLNNGAATALDLAVALTEYNGRDPQVAAEIENLLTLAGNRGEGGAIRLLSRLQSDTRPEAEVYAQFAETIEARGDFLAMMFAIPHVAEDKVDDYINRAVSVMNCGNKDVDELADAFALRARGTDSYHWLQVGLHFESGHVLSKLRLSNRQIAAFRKGTAPDPVALAKRDLAVGDASALGRLVALTGNDNLETYDAQAAAGYLAQAIDAGDAATLAGLVALYRASPQAVRLAVDENTDITAAVAAAAEGGDVESAYAFGMLSRDQAKTEDDLTRSAKWLQEAAERGHRDAMYEYGKVLGYGLGRPGDPAEALLWLDQAAALGHPEARDVAGVVRIKGGL